MRICNALIMALMLMTLTANAGIYMGTDADLPQPYVAQPTKSAALKPAVGNFNPPKAAPSSNPCQPPLVSDGKGPCTPPFPKAPVAKSKPKPKPKHPDLIVHLHTGSLKWNVVSIVRQSHWGRVVWTLPFDYKWIGDITMRGPDVQSILAQLLKPYPVQAVFYDKNHVVAIVRRRPQ